ncbi:EAL and HDOD domain-containing protein [Motiliproteus sediminis]|uniref:EAL and HDOD domain-containing protein n=1 Tax=Motiliproteus sediminis TaxID=1468178 RepID=UPI001AEFDE97|nr:HDOD domain-containing protein [Motiliproteus sediminis]
MEALTTSASQVLMVRQPVFSKELKIVAYELLYEQTPKAEDELFNADRASSEILLNTYTSLCQDGAIRRVPLILSLSQELLAKGCMPDLPRNQIVLQIPAAIRVGPNVLANVRALAEQDFTLALDGFALQQPLIPLLRYMNIIKVDLSAVPEARLGRLVSVLKRSSATLLAQNVASFDQLKRCGGMGFKLFQGPFISRPVRVMGKQLPSSSVALLQLLQELQKPDITPAQIEGLILLDPILTFRILRVVNSAAYHLTTSVESITQAVVMLGMDQVRKWATLIALSSQEGKPEEVSRNLLVRGRMCQLLAEQQGGINPETAFMVGIMSQLDVLLEMPLEELLLQIPLDNAIKAAITEQQGPLGKLLGHVMLYEEGHWETLKAQNVEAGFFEAAYRHSLSWAQSAMESLSDDN